MKARFLLVVLLLAPFQQLFARSDSTNWCGSKGPQMTEYFIKQHEFRREMGQIPEQLQSAAPPISQAGNIVVMKADTQNFIGVNPFDLLNKKITFSRNSGSGYNLKVTGAALGTISGTPVHLGDDATIQVKFTNGFSFPFFGTTYTSVFVNSDGNLTFARGDSASTDRDVFRVVSGPPRICPFFQDMNPTLGGSIKVLQSSTRFSVTWDGISQFLQSGSNSNTFQVNLFKNGTIEIVFGSRMDTKDGIVGISAGNTTTDKIKLVNYAAQTSLNGIQNTVVLERFATSQQIDWSGLIQEFLQVYPPQYDFIVVFTDFPVGLGPNTFAFFSHLQNPTRGLGLPIFNYTPYFHTTRMQGFLAMGWLGRYPDDPNRQFLGTNNTLEVMGQENGHRWLAYPQVMINGVKTRDLLGRDDAHWNFYMDTDASVMEGNDIRDNGNGTFTTVASTQTYSKLDQYFIGLLSPGAVPPFFFVAGPADKGRAPEVGVVFSGTRVNVNVQQIIQANGVRVPAAAQAQKVYKEAFILFTKGNNPLPQDLQKVDRIRVAWSAFFHKQTGNRGTMDTTVAPPQ